MSPHRVLTESSLSPHHRKGREGKGRGKEGPTEGRIHRYGLYRSASTARFALVAAPTMDGRSAALGGGR